MAIGPIDLEGLLNKLPQPAPSDSLGEKIKAEAAALLVVERYKGLKDLAESAQNPATKTLLKNAQNAIEEAAGEGFPAALASYKTMQDAYATQQQADVQQTPLGPSLG